MDPSLPNQSPDKTVDEKASFRKLGNDASGRRYRRHSPARGVDSSSPDETSTRELGHGQVSSKHDHVKDDRRRINDRKELDKDYYDKYGRSGHSYMDSERGDRDRYMSSHGRHRDFQTRHRRDADAEDRACRKSSRSDGELRDDHHHVKQEDRSRGGANRYSRNKYGNGQHSNDSRAIDWDRQRDRGARDDKRDHRWSPGKYTRESSNIYSQSDHGTDKMESAEHEGGINRRRHDKDHEGGRNKYNRESEENLNKRGSLTCEDRDLKNDSDKTIHDSEEKTISLKKQKSVHQENTVDSIAGGRKLSESKYITEDEKPVKQVKDGVPKFTSEVINSSLNQADAATDFDAAKVAAMKAAELVNKNIAGTGFLSTDQKKKLLWGNKKKAAPEESSGSRWDLPLFSDRERQEKFNKLMSLRLRWYLWPIVGCERRDKARPQARGQRWKPSYGEARAAGDGFGETIHSRAPAERWPNRWSRPVSSPSAAGSSKSTGRTPAPMDTECNSCITFRSVSVGAFFAPYPMFHPLKYMVHMGSSSSLVLPAFFSHFSAILASHIQTPEAAFQLGSPAPEPASESSLGFPGWPGLFWICED